MGYGSAHGTADAALYGPVDRAQYDAPVAQQEPFTNQLQGRLVESEKRLIDLTERVVKLGDRLLGPDSRLKPERNNSLVNTLGEVPIKRSMIDTLLAQSNTVNYKLEELVNLFSRLEAL